MKKTKIILTIIFAAAALVVLYFAYGVVKDRYLGTNTKSLDINNTESQNEAGDQSAAETDGQPSNGQSNTSPDINDAAPGAGRPNIQNADCDNNCADFADNTDNLKYCQEACGDRPVSVKESEEQCENIIGLEKDSCWRDLAVSKKDTDICDKISDAKLKKVCVNRVTEEILDQ